MTKFNGKFNKTQCFGWVLRQKRIYFRFLKGATIQYQIEDFFFLVFSWDACNIFISYIQCVIMENGKIIL